MKTLRLLTFAALALHGALAYAADSSAYPKDAEGRIVAQDERAAFLARACRVRSPQVVHPKPLFADAPFLRLRKGDRLVRAKVWSTRFKGDAGGFSREDGLLLHSGGKYYWLDVTYQPTTIIGSAFHSVAFDWDVNLDNAKVLFKMDFPSGKHSSEISPLAYRRMREAVAQKFPQALRPEGDATTKPAHIEGSGAAKCAVFEGLAFEENGVFKYQVRLGKGIYLVKKRFLISGPPETPKFDLRQSNKPLPPRPKGAYEKSHTFLRVVAPFLSPERSKWLLAR